MKRETCSRLSITQESSGYRAIAILRQIYLRVPPSGYLRSNRKRQKGRAARGWANTMWSASTKCPVSFDQKDGVKGYQAIHLTDSVTEWRARILPFEA
jgi:hypothetical protein